MRNALIILAACLGTPVYGIPLVQESFETDGEGARYTSNTYVGSDIGGNISDFFVRHQFHGVGGSNPHPQHADAIGKIDGAFAWASEDIASNGNPLGIDGPGIVRLADLNTIGFAGLQVTVGMAISRDDQRWETDDFVRVQFAFDGDGGGTDLSAGSYTIIGQFVGDRPMTDGDLRQDTDLDGLADPGAPKLTTTLTDYTFSIPTTGKSLSVQVRLDQNGGFEEFVFDNIRVTAAAEFLLGDVNGDNQVNGEDVQPFIEHLLNGPYRLEADMNGDGVIDGRDTAPFVAAVQGGSTHAVPEPATFWLTAIGLLGLVAFGWRHSKRTA